MPISKLIPEHGKFRPGFVHPVLNFPVMRLPKTEQSAQVHSGSAGPKHFEGFPSNTDVARQCAVALTIPAQFGLGLMDL